PAMDVWYEFEATTTSHGVVLTAEGFVYGVFIEVYEEDICTGFIEPIACAQTTELVVDDLTIGTTYKVRIYTTSTTNDFDFEVRVLSLTPLSSVADNGCSVQGER